MLTHCQVRDEFSRLTLSSTAPALVKVFFCNRCIGGSRIYKSLLFSTILSSHTQHNNTMAQSSRPHGYVADINFRWQLGILILIMAIWDEVSVQIIYSSAQMDLVSTLAYRWNIELEQESLHCSLQWFVRGGMRLRLTMVGQRPQ